MIMMIDDAINFIPIPLLQKWACRRAGKTRTPDLLELTNGTIEFLDVKRQIRGGYDGNEPAGDNMATARLGGIWKLRLQKGPGLNTL
jgi:hypothetical protein